MGFFEFIGLANNLPFAISLTLMAGIAGLQMVSLVLGLGISEVVDSAVDFDADVDVDIGIDVDVDVDVDVDMDLDIDTDVDVHTGTHLSDQLDLNGEGPSFASNFFGWLQLGKVPFLILLSAFLGTFGLFGAIGQWIVTGFLGAPITPLIAGPLALLAALPATRIIGRVLSKIMPKEESNSILLEDLTGGVATITIGVASAEMAAEAKIVDVHGTIHYVRVKPLDASKKFQQGTEVRLMEKKGDTFKVVEQ